MHWSPERRNLVWGRYLFYFFRRAGDIFEGHGVAPAELLQTILRTHRADDDCALFHTFNRLWNSRPNPFVGRAVLLRPGAAEALAEPAGSFVCVESARRLFSAAKNGGLAQASV